MAGRSTGQRRRHAGTAGIENWYVSAPSKFFYLFLFTFADCFAGQGDRAVGARRQKKRCHMTEVGSRKRRMEMSEKAKGKRKVTEMDDEGAENKEKTDGGRKRRRVTVRDPEEMDWVRRVTEFIGRMEEWEKRREAREARQEDRSQRMMVMVDRMMNRMERLVVLTKEMLTELREDEEGEPEDGNGGGKADGDDDVDGEDEDMEN